jgi:hypothetical protein
MIKHHNGAGGHFGHLSPHPMLPVGSDETTDEPMSSVDANTAMLRQRIQLEPRLTRGQHFLRLLRSLTPIGA